jgi:hypothetical protein
VIGILVNWLSLSYAMSEKELEEDIDLTLREKDYVLNEGSILWGYGKSFALPGGIRPKALNILTADKIVIKTGENSDKAAGIASLTWRWPPAM